MLGYDRTAPLILPHHTTPTPHTARTSFR